MRIALKYKVQNRLTTGYVSCSVEMDKAVFKNNDTLAVIVISIIL